MIGPRQGTLTTSLAANMFGVGAALVQTFVPATAQFFVASPFALKLARNQIFALQSLRVGAAPAPNCRLLVTGWTGIGVAWVRAVVWLGVAATGQ